MCGGTHRFALNAGSVGRLVRIAGVRVDMYFLKKRRGSMVASMRSRDFSFGGGGIVGGSFIFV